MCDIIKETIVFDPDFLYNELEHHMYKLTHFAIEEKVFFIDRAIRKYIDHLMTHQPLSDLTYYCKTDCHAVNSAMAAVTAITLALPRQIGRASCRERV